MIERPIPVIDLCTPFIATQPSSRILSNRNVQLFSTPKSSTYLYGDKENAVAVPGKPKETYVMCTVCSQSSVGRKPHSTVAIPEKPKETYVMCPVCLQSSVGRKPHSTACGHVFCGNCIKQAVLTHRCPTCKKFIFHGNIFPLFI